MNFDDAFTYLFNGVAVVLDDDTLLYIGEDDDSFYLDIDDGARRLVFNADNNQGTITTYGKNGFILYDDKGKKHSICRLVLG